MGNFGQFSLFSDDNLGEEGTGNKLKSSEEG